MLPDRYKVVTDGETGLPGQFYWGVQDTETGKLVVFQESFTIADFVCDSLNGKPMPTDISELREVAGALEASLSSLA